jgi:NADPH:quinone reductase
MQAWMCFDPVGVDALTWSTLPDPSPGPGQVLVGVAAASLNFPDVLIVQNKYQLKPALPFVPGAEFSGTVLAVGDAVEHLRVGQRVACLQGTGGFATHVLAQASQCLPLPDDFDLVDAAAFIMTYATGWHALVDRGQLVAGETVLVLGAAGGVGTAAIQLAKAQGARVIAVAGGADKCALCAAIGADATIDHQVHGATSGLRDEIKRLSAGKGPDVVYDPVGGDLAEPVLRSIAWRGRYLVIGFASGPIPALPWNLCLLKGASLVGVFWGEFAHKEPQANRTMLQTLLRCYQAGQIKPVIDATLPMQQLPQAYTRMQSRQVKGKLVLINP